MKAEEGILARGTFWSRWTASHIYWDIPARSGRALSAKYLTFSIANAHNSNKLRLNFKPDDYKAYED
jgi:hypothetical protein